MHVNCILTNIIYTMIFLEGKGSLLSFLKGKGWATSLSAGVGDDGINRSSLAYVFGMSIHLTDSGLEKVNGYILTKLKAGDFQSFLNCI